MKRSLFFQSMAAMLGILVLSCNSEQDIQSAPKEQPEISTCIPIDASRADLISILTDLDKVETRHSFPRPRVIANEFSVSRGVPTRSGDTDSVTLHVFNFADNQGYAIMSGDERYPSLIALTESGNIDRYGDNQVNGGVSVFLEGLEDIFDNPPLNPRDTLPVDEKEYDTYGPWANNVIKNGAECKVKWGQENPYNIVVKAQNNDREVCTGCVPTAVAQLMSVHRFPADFHGMPFNWDEMTRYSSATWLHPLFQHQIALLMSLLGTKGHLDVTYRTRDEGGSPANTNYIPRTLKDFGYASGGQVVVYQPAKLVKELQDGYPVLVSGSSIRERVEIGDLKFSYKYSNGHQWLAHGLLERKRTVCHHNKYGKIISTNEEVVYYPRYNWGWESKDDGYFLSTIFKTGNSYAPDDTRGEEGELGNYQFNTKLVLGIRK